MDIDYQDYYRDRDYLKYKEMFRNIFMMRFRIIKRFINKGRVLEIGCSNGTFLEIFKNDGWNTLGIEPSQNYKLAGEAGIRVIHEYFEEARLPKNYFDLVVLNHTLEHMENPLKVLRKVNSVLKKDGIVFVDVPNVGSLLSRIMRDKWPYLLPEEHKWQFTRSSLGEIFERAGFKIIFWKSRSGIFEYANPIKEVGRKRFIYDIASFPFSLAATALNMGDSMSMIGKK